MNAQSITFLSVLAGLTAYAGLTIFFVFGMRRGITGRAALLASILTAAWYAALLFTGISPLSQALELSAYIGWILLLARILGVSRETVRNSNYRSQVRLTGYSAVAYLAGIGSLVVLANGIQEGAELLAMSKLALCLLGLVFVEQAARNTRRDFQWRLKFMSVGLGTLFGYGFVLHADTVLFQAINLTLFAPQGFVNSIAVPLIAVASMRNKTQNLNFNVSRQFIFRTGVLVLAGSYLVIMGIAGYYVRFFGGAWGDVFVILVVVAGVVGLVTITLSTQVQSALRVALKRNLYEYKYDYREEWMRVSRELTERGDDPLEERVIHAVGELVQSNSGALLRLTDENVLVPQAEINALETHALPRATSQALVEFFNEREWIIDLSDYRADPDTVPALNINPDEPDLNWVRFIVPLVVQDGVFGVLLLGHPSVAMSLDWEDYDALKLAARQSAGFLALNHADAALATAQQFQVREELAAFVVHDLKTISGQLSLMLRNAETHHANPEFQADFLKTVDNAVSRMDRLLRQLRNPDTASTRADVDLVAIVRGVVEERSTQTPAPTFSGPAEPCITRADADQVRSALVHLVQNAQEATPDDGRVEVAVGADGPWIHIEITDTGTGMAEGFVKERLFSPFQSSKGVAGVGIGAYQARQTIRGFGGDLTVRSRLGDGTTFTARLPLAEPADTDHERSATS